MQVSEGEAAVAGTETGSEWRAGWRPLIGAALGSGTGYLLFQMTAGIFIRPMQDDLGWSTSTLAFAPVVLLLGALLLPLGGAIIDRFGPRPVAIVGLVLFAVAYFFLGLMPENPIALYVIIAFLVIISPLGYYGAYIKVVGSWFQKNVGMAIGLCMNGVTVGSIISLPILGMVIANWGWRAGYFTLAGIVLFVGLPIVALFFRENPLRATVTPSTKSADSDSNAPEVEGVTLKEALRDSRYWLLLLSFALATIPLGGFFAHLQPLLRNASLSTETAGTIGVLLALSMGIGRLAGGFLLDRLWPYGIASLFLLPPAAGAWYLAGITPDSSLILVCGAVILLGLAHGAEADFVAYFTLKLFGQRHFSSIFGMFAMTVLLGSALGGISFSLTVDHFGSYRLAAYVGGVLYLVSAAVLFTTGLVDRGREARAARRSASAPDAVYASERHAT